MANKTFSITTIKYRNEPSPVPLYGFFSNYPQVGAAKIQFQATGLLVSLYDPQGGQITQLTGSWSLSATNPMSWQLAITGEGLGQLAGTWNVSLYGGTLNLTNSDWRITATQVQG